MNKNLIIAILIIVIVGIAAFMVFSHPGTTGNKVNTQMNMLSAASLQNGDQIEFQLKDDKGNLLSGQMVEIQFSDGAGNNETFKVITDTNGKGYLVLEDESAGSHDFTATYAGNGNYSGSTLKETITISDGDSNSDANDSYNSSTANSDTPSNSSSNSTDSNSTDNTLNYDKESGLYYDSNGIVQGGQCDGMSIDDIRKNGGDPFKDMD
jgi:hypothetical protein